MDSFQKEIPSSRVNITLNVDADGKRKKKELPLKLLVLANLSHKESQKRISDRQRLRIDNQNLDSALCAYSPEIHFTLDNKTSTFQKPLRVDLTFRKLKDFHPDAIAQNVPELKRLIAMRNLLKDLKANITDNRMLKKTLTCLLSEAEHRKLIQAKINKIRGDECA